MTGRYPPSPAEQERSAQRWAARISLVVFMLGVLCIAAQYGIAALVPGPSRAVATSSMVLLLLAPVTLGMVGATLALVARRWLLVALNSLLVCAPFTIFGLASLLAR